MSEEQERALRDYDAASRKVQQQLTMTKGGRRAEVAYGDAYQQMVAVGIAPQIKAKYRP